MAKYEKVRKVVIPCAGYGTRFMPATKGTPKELFTLVDKPALMYHLEECMKSGIREVLIITNEDKKPIFEKFLTHNEKIESSMERAGTLHYLDGLNKIIDNMKIDYVIQPVMNGTGGAVLLAEEWTNGEPFAMMFGDDLYDEFDGRPAIGELILQFEKNADGQTIVGAQTVSDEDILKYSSIRTTKQVGERCFEFDKIVEKPKAGEAPSNLSGLGRYILQSDIFDYIRKTPPRGKNSEVGITDTFDLIAQNEKIYCFDLPQKHYDLGSKSESLTAIVEYALKSEEFGVEFRNYLKTLSLD